MTFVDTHRHFMGCLQPEWVSQNIPGIDLETATQRLTFGDYEPREYHRFLDKFTLYDGIDWTEDLFDKSIKSVSDSFIAEDLSYTWLDCSVNKYKRFEPHEAMRFIYDRFEAYIPGQVGLLLAIAYERMTPESVEAILKSLDKMMDILIGVDFVGDESKLCPELCRPIIIEFRKANRLSRMHVSELTSWHNSITAIQMGVTNIAHGIHIMDNHLAVKRAKDEMIVFDVAISSNYMTGVWGPRKQHPVVAMKRAGLMVTLGADDPCQCKTTIAQEYELAKQCGLTEREMQSIRGSAAIAHSEAKSVLNGTLTAAQIFAKADKIKADALLARSAASHSDTAPVNPSDEV